MSLIDIQIQPKKFYLSDSNNYEELNVLLAKDDNIDKRCGEIFISQCKILVFLCNDCNEIFSSYEEFFNHLCEQHVSIDDDLKYEVEDQDEELMNVEYYDESLIIVDKDQDDEEMKPMIKSNSPKNPIEKDDVSQDAQDGLSQDCEFSLEDDEGSKDFLENYEEIDNYDSTNEIKDDKTESFLNDFSKFLEKDCREIVECELRKNNTPESTPNLKSEIDPFALDSLIDGHRFECNQCDMAFNLPSKLKTHIKTHTKDRRFKCHICGFAFTEQFNLRSHIKRHSGARPHECKLCDKKFITRNELKTHERIHTGERPYICEICGNGYVTSGSLNEHRKRHYNYRPHKCSECDKAFFDTGLLRDHMVVHTGERTHVCDVCQASFTRRKALLQHLKLHSAVKQYKCEFCEKEFAQKPGLASHLKTHRNVQDLDSDRKFQMIYVDVIQSNYKESSEDV